MSHVNREQFLNYRRNYYKTHKQEMKKQQYLYNLAHPEIPLKASRKRVDTLSERYIVMSLLHRTPFENQIQNLLLPPELIHLKRLIIQATRCYRKAFKIKLSIRTTTLPYQMLS